MMVGKTRSVAQALNSSHAASPNSRTHTAIPPKRLGRLRMNWFGVGALFGIALSFFMNFVFMQVLLPGYQSVVALGKPELVAMTPSDLTPVKNTADQTNPSAPEQNDIAVATATTPLPNSALSGLSALLSSAEASTAPQAPIIAALTEPEPPEPVSLKVGSGDTLLDMLLAQQVPSAEAYEVVNTLKKEVDPRSLRVGQKIALTLQPHEALEEKNAVHQLALKLPDLSTVALERMPDGDFSVKAQAVKLSSDPYRGIGTVSSSLYQAAEDAGIPISAMHHIVQAFSYDVDFQRDIHPGDKIEVLLDRKTTDEGEIGGYEKLRYAALTLRNKKQEIFYYKGKNGNHEWFGVNGKSVRKSLLRTPVHAARISSGFGLRRHPILGYSKMHKGVDFAAPSGTPIYAAGDGVITYRARYGGYGNYIKIRHNGTYSTAYAHLSKFRSNVKKGSRVKQGQVIGYVGSTGRSTGPHLHYEVIQNGKAVNPRAQRFNTATELAGNHLKSYKLHMSSIRSELAALTPHKGGAQFAQAQTHTNTQ